MEIAKTILAGMLTLTATICLLGGYVIAWQNIVSGYLMYLRTEIAGLESKSDRFVGWVAFGFVVALALSVAGIILSALAMAWIRVFS